MSARSSSVSGRSWSGDERAAPDIIDLDKFMRGAVRPSRRNQPEARRDQLVVDAGGVERKIPALAKLGGASTPAGVPGAPGPVPGPPAVTSRGHYSSSSGSTPPPQAKRFSHDSGLSDGSYTKRKQRPARQGKLISGRRTTVSEMGRKSNSVSRTLAGGTSSDSLRAFRAVCERALLDQQVQIAKVAELCERLSERQNPTAAPSVTARASAPTHKSVSSSHSTDETSSTQSTRSRDSRRKDKHRTEECKTYKIIMTKLDELNRLFAARAHAQTPAPAARPGPGPAPASSGSVSVSDKLVSTEPALLHPHHLVPRHTCVVTDTCELDIAPRTSLMVRRNIATERVVTGDSANNLTSTCGFDLEDPIHLYSQAKRLQALPVLKRRARSVEPVIDHRFSERLGLHHGQHAAAHAGHCDPRDTTLCALCRGYWRSFRQYVATQFFCYPSGNT